MSELTRPGVPDAKSNPDVLRFRAGVIRRLRAFFEGRDFLEVETPVRIAAPAPEEHIDCPEVVTGGFLRASPELQMKKLLAAGLERIFEIGPCFRDGELGSRHHPEFTMIEWYRRGGTYLDIADDLQALLAELGEGRLGQPRRLTVREAYGEFAGWDPWMEEFDRDRFDLDMATKVEPAIRELGGGVFLFDYPPAAASLAKVSGSPAVAERWEFYYDGLELANCFTELCDGVEQRRRFEASRAARRELGEADYPLDEEFLGKVDAMESAAGVALGVDRLVMVLSGERDIARVRIVR